MGRYMQFAIELWIVGNLSPPYFGQMIVDRFNKKRMIHLVQQSDR